MPGTFKLSYFFILLPLYCFFVVNMLMLTLQLLEKDPTKRLTRFDLLKNHPFFERMDWHALFNMQITPPEELVPPFPVRSLSIPHSLPSTLLIIPSHSSLCPSLSPLPSPLSPLHYLYIFLFSCFLQVLSKPPKDHGDADDGGELDPPVFLVDTN